MPAVIVHEKRLEEGSLAERLVVGGATPLNSLLTHLSTYGHIMCQGISECVQDNASTLDGTSGRGRIQ